jgi:hypothetical protein
MTVISSLDYAMPPCDQVAEATKQATAMQASLTKLQSDKDALKRDGATVYARMKASEGQVAVVSGAVGWWQACNVLVLVHVREAFDFVIALKKEHAKPTARRQIGFKQGHP